MAFISVTRLRLRSIRFLPAFMWYAARSKRQAKKSEGLLAVATRRSRGLTFWTLTMWARADDMVAFRRAPPHRSAMSKLQHWCSEAAVTNWGQMSDDLPAWSDAAARLRADPKLIQVNRPTAQHLAGQMGD